MEVLPDFIAHAVAMLPEPPQPPLHQTVKAEADAALANTRDTLLKEATARGVQLYVPPVRASVKDGSERWPTSLARLLCKSPDKAKLSNDVLIAEVSRTLALDEPLRTNRMSKPLSTAAIKHVGNILKAFGYDPSTVKRGTDIKRIVKNNIRAGSTSAKQTNTEFLADGVKLNGKRYLYKARQRDATGQMLDDACIRIAGCDVPLIAVVTILGMGRQEFLAADEAAQAGADPDQIENRRSLQRAPKNAQAHHRLCSRCAGGLHSGYPRATTTELVRAWCQIHPGAGNNLLGLKALIDDFAYTGTVS